MWNFLGGLEESHTEGDAMYVHGSPRVPTKEYMVPQDIRNREKMTEIFSMIRRSASWGTATFPVSTPTRSVSCLRRGAPRPTTHQGGKALINVGSVGQPRDGDPRASYAVLDGKTINFHRIEYDVRTTMDKIYATPGLPNYLADRLIVGR